MSIAEIQARIVKAPMPIKEASTRVNRMVARAKVAITKVRQAMVPTMNKGKASHNSRECLHPYQGSFC